MSVEIEVWKTVEGFPDYQISNLGRVRSGIRKKGLLNQSRTSRGYKKVSLWRNGAMKTGLIHRLVASAFLPNPNDLTDVNHKDGNKQNNCVDNLEWSSRSTNQKHAYTHNLYSRSNGSSKRLSRTEAMQVLSLRKSGMPQKEIAIQFGITEGAVSHIVNGRTWKSLHAA